MSLTNKMLLRGVPTTRVLFSDITYNYTLSANYDYVNNTIYYSVWDAHENRIHTFNTLDSARLLLLKAMENGSIDETNIDYQI
jgi:type IV secretory pathway VirB6-like protein